MEARELRIGNIVHYDFMGHDTSIRGIGTDVLWLNGIEHGGGPISIDNFSPIPLTEEWLLKFGFSAKDYKKGYIGIDHKAGSMITDFVLTYPKVLGEHQDVFVWEHSKWKYNTLKYVHELQNLFYCLTGEELTLTP